VFSTLSSARFGSEFPRNVYAKHEIIDEEKCRCRAVASHILLLGGRACTLGEAPRAGAYLI